MQCCSGLSRTRKAKIAIAWFFFVTGATLGNWASLLPFVKDEQNISNGELGLILLAAIGGALIALPIITHCNNKYGSGYSTMGSGVIMMLFFPLVGLRNGVGVFTVAVCMLGFVIGCLDVSANGQAVLCEKITKIPTLGLFHCVYSIGAFTGAVVGGLVMEQPSSSVLKEVVLFGLILLVPGLSLSPWLYSPQEEREHTDQQDSEHEASLLVNPLLGPAGTQDDAQADSEAGGSAAYTTDSENASLHGNLGKFNGTSDPQASNSSNNGYRDSNSNNDVQGAEEDSCWGSYAKYFILLQISFLTFLAFFGEGSVNDWSVIYFTDELDTSPFVSTLGFAGFELSVATGRYFSDFTVQRVGRQRLMVLSGAVASAGMGLVVLAPSLFSVHSQSAALQTVSVLGFSICGLGLSSLAPSAISLAGSDAITRSAGMTSADGIALVTSVGYLGVMLSPPFLGGMSVLLHSLRWSFAIAAVLITPIAVVSFSMKKSIFEGYDKGMQRHSNADIVADSVPMLMK